MLRQAIKLTVPLLAFPALVLGSIVQAESSRPTPIEHVVVIFQENHSFDNVLGILCIQLGRCMGPQTAANGKPIGLLHDGSVITLPNAGDVVSPSPHSHDAQVTAMNGGAMNGFDLMVEGDHDCDRPYVCYEAFDPNKIPNLAALATEFVIADHTFQSDPAASWGGHLSLVAGAADGFFITYDDCGCFYDHVAPPSPELGIRVPMVVVSPFARRGFTDTNVASYASLLAFTEYVFGLQPLADADANAYAFLNSFDFGQLLLGPVPMVTSPVAADELAYIAAHPPPGDDDT